MIVFASLTDKGERNINEDSIGAANDGLVGFFVLADGLGGHDKGEVASQLVVEQSMKHHAEFLGDIEGCFIHSQNHLIDEQRRLNAVNEMKTTMVCLYIADGKAAWGHVGDSRLYHFKNGKLAERTLDHSVPQMLVASGEIREKDICGHSDRNRLLRVMGMEWDVPKYVLGDPVGLTGKNVFLLCSDGFWEWTTTREMEKTLKKAATPESWLDSMKARIMKNGAGRNMDNFSAIAIFAD
ncbi:MAG: protein phosphatase 2C domain-containing protein [Clostridiales Family XIII bacterium]|jgi:serine/threonine protein phosphatase PrpC|nr:protein phosphatase 2C domain-containing protein [Clostridiales Family XIII bacterium]